MPRAKPSGLRSTDALTYRQYKTHSAPAATEKINARSKHAVRLVTTFPAFSLTAGLSQWQIIKLRVAVEQQGRCFRPQFLAFPPPKPARRSASAMAPPEAAALPAWGAEKLRLDETRSPPPERAGWLPASSSSRS